MSNITIYRFALDMTPGGVTPVVHLSQYDEAFQLEFTLYSRSGELDIPSGATAMIEGTKLDGKAYSANATISENVVTVAGDVQISAVAGNNPFQIVLKSGNSTVGSANFTISVERAAMDYDTVSDSKLAQIQDVTATAAQLTAAAENVTDGVETFEALAESVSDMLADITDDTLSITDKAADAAAVGNALAAEIAPKYSTSATYAVGDYVIYNNALYRCNTAIATAESWTAAHWTAVKVGSELSNLKSDLNDEFAEITAKMVRVSSENKWDTENEVVGAITANGTVYPTYTNYVYPDIPIEVNEGDIVRSYEINAGGGFATAGMRWLCAYDANMNPVAESSSNTNITTYTVPSGIKYIRPSFNSGGQKRMLTINYEATNFINYEVYYAAGDGFHNNIKMSQTNFDDLYLDYSMVNRLDPSECQIGKFINGTTGAISDNSGYFVTNYIPIRNGETLYFMQIDKQTSVNARSIAVYDGNKDLLDTLGTNTGTDHFTQSGNAEFIRCAFPYFANDVIRSPYGIGVMSASNPEYVTGEGSTPVFKSKYTRPIINVFASDTEQTVIAKFVEAFRIGGCDVVFEQATYTFGTYLSTVKDDYHLLMNEIPIGNGCRYCFNGARLVAVLPLETLPDETSGDEYYCNFFGCQSRPSAYEMHDGVLESTDTRYVIHDESHGYEGTYKHLYQNMEMHYHTSVRTENIRKCIGGGTGVSGVVEIIGCKFTTDAQDACVSYHGNDVDVSGATFDLHIRDSYFSNGVRGGVLSASQTARLYYVGNYAQTAPLTYERWAVTAFNNTLAN